MLDIKTTDKEKVHSDDFLRSVMVKDKSNLSDDSDEDADDPYEELTLGVFYSATLGKFCHCNVCIDL